MLNPDDLDAAYALMYDELADDHSEEALNGFLEDQMKSLLTDAYDNQEAFAQQLQQGGYTSDGDRPAIQEQQ